MPGQQTGSGEPTVNAGWELPERSSGTPGTEGDGPTGTGGTAGSAGSEEESWEDGLPGGTGSGSGDDDWETSNQVPAQSGTADIPPMPTERDRAGSGADGELDGALEDFDGEILAEREVIRSRSNETAGTNSGGSLPSGGGETSSGEVAGGGTADGPRMPGGPVGVPSNRNVPPPPSPAATASVPDDIPDARDDDIIARQLREAAMAETDPELKEKLWDEYRRYKGI